MPANAGIQVPATDSLGNEGALRPIAVSTR